MELINKKKGITEKEGHNHSGYFDLINMSESEKAHQMDIQEAIFTELVNTELSVLFKEKRSYSWNNIKKKVIQLEDGDVSATNLPG